MSILETLTMLGKRINQYYPTINRGGCAVYASIIGDHLQKMGFTTGIIVACFEIDPDVTIDKARKKLSNTLDADAREWNANGVHFNHVGVEFIFENRIYHCDTNGVNPASKSFDGMDIFEGRLTVEECRSIADKDVAWNSRFDRNSIPSIRRHIEKFLTAHA